MKDDPLINHANARGDDARSKMRMRRKMTGKRGGAGEARNDDAKMRKTFDDDDPKPRCPNARATKDYVARKDERVRAKMMSFFFFDAQNAARARVASRAR